MSVKTGWSIIKKYRIMREKGWLCRPQKKKWISTTDSNQFYGFQISMSRKGNPYDNAFAESFMKTLKSEEVHLWEYRTMEDVQKRIPYFIEDVYNHKRLHSAIGYRPPCEFELMLESQPDPGQNTLITLA